MKKLLLGGGGELVNYDYLDIANGLGYTTFYLFTSNNPVAEYHLSNIKVFSNTSIVSGADIIPFVTTAFNLPRTLNGNAYIDIYGHTDGGTWSCSGALILVRGADETNIGNFICPTAVGASVDVIKTSKMAISQTNIKKGDVLKLLLQGVDNNNFIRLDPTGIYSVVGTTQIHLPFKLDI